MCLSRISDRSLLEIYATSGFSEAESLQYLKCPLQTVFKSWMNAHGEHISVCVYSRYQHVTLCSEVPCLQFTLY